ncbi:MAG: 3-deoxy-8-phosphooctulonate synthase [Planctomycetota bacterium]|nr:3-deoxy-8-phosphooctulonate synthase [Planctomycetota bacterium]
MTSPFEVGGVSIGDGSPLFLIAGPCVLQTPEMALEIGSKALEVANRLGVPYIFKASFDKANRSSIHSLRGPGLETGLDWLGRIKRELGVPVTTDIHEVAQAAPAAEVVDIVQIPAFLCRQTDLLVAAAQSGAAVNVKKGQFLAPWDIRHAVGKVREAGCDRVVITERGASFGYNTLVSDMRAIPVMSEFAPVIFDGTHSVQQPGGLGDRTGGQREMIPTLARAAVAAGAHGVFLEVHTDPASSPSDGPNMLPMDDLEPLLASLVRIRAALEG